MGVLTSKLFTNAEPPVAQRLEDCATGRPNEVLSHFALNQSGEHIRKVQEALRSIQASNPGLGIPQFEVSGVYDRRFADAIRVYKTKRDIRNFSSKIDDIVGVKTIRSLDRENKSGAPKVNPSPSPSPKKPEDFPKPQRSSARFIRRTFFKNDRVQNVGDPRGQDAKEGADAVRELFLDKVAPEASLARFTSGPGQTASFPSDFRVNRFTTLVVDDTQLLEGGVGMLTTTNITMSWEWGPPLPTVSIVKNGRITVFGTATPPTSTTRSVPRAEGEKTPFFVPPNP